MKAMVCIASAGNDRLNHFATRNAAKIRAVAIIGCRVGVRFEVCRSRTEHSTNPCARNRKITGHDRAGNLRVQPASELDTDPAQSIHPIQVTEFGQPKQRISVSLGGPVRNPIPVGVTDRAGFWERVIHVPLDYNSKSFANNCIRRRNMEF